MSPPKLEAPLYKKRNLDFTDYAYREAVNRLKFLLAESYTPSKSSTTLYLHRQHIDDSGEETDNQSLLMDRPVLSEISKYLPGRSLSRYNSLKKLDYPMYTKDSNYLYKTASSTPNLQPPQGTTISRLFL